MTQVAIAKKLVIKFLYFVLFLFLDHYKKKEKNKTKYLFRI